MPNRLREVREAQNVSQTELAERMGTSRGQIIKLETGERRLSLDWIEKAAAALNVRMSEIIEGSDETEAELTHALIEKFMQLDTAKKRLVLTIIDQLGGPKR